MKRSDIVNVAIIGSGRQGARRAKAAAECGDSISICIDINLGSAKKLASTYNAKFSSNWKDAVNDKKVDCIIVCTPNDSHFEISSAALKVGKSVLCEKPMCKNATQAKELFELSEKSKALLKCGFNHRHHQAIWQAKKIVDGGEIGRILFMRCRYGIAGRPDYDKDWRTNPTISGGGQLIDQGQHVIDLFRWFGGEINEVMGYANTLYWKIPVEDNAFALLKADAGHICTMHVSWTEWRNLFSFEVFGDKGYVKIEGLKGAYGDEKLIVGMKDLTGPFTEKITDFRGEDVSWREEWKEFCGAIKQKREVQGNAYDGFCAVRIAEQIYESSKSGKAISSR